MHKHAASSWLSKERVYPVRNRTTDTMQTYTHFLWALFLSHRECCRSHSRPPFAPRAFLFGSVLPDLPLILTTVVCVLVDATLDRDWTSHLFSEWYFENRWVMAEHNVFHSPITLSIMLMMTYFVWRCNGSRDFGASFFWVLVSCSLHSACDIPVHHDDGPLLLFPVNWQYRFASPVSYWDPEYHGREIAFCEHILDVVIISWWCRKRWLSYRSKTSETVEMTTLMDEETAERTEGES